MKILKRPKVSLIVANYNNENYLEECLLSISSQTYKNVELIIVDDGSCDNSKYIIEKFKSKNRNLQIKTKFYDENVGGGRAKLAGIEMVEGEFACFVDSDDFLERNAIEKVMEQYLSLSDGYSMVYTNANKVDSNSVLMGSLNYAKHGRNFLEDKVAFHLAIWRMSSYNKLKNKFNPEFRIAYDIDLYYKLEEVGKVEFLELYLYNYRVHLNNISIGFDKLGNSWTERIIAIADAQRRRGTVDIINIGNQLQNQFNKIQLNKNLNRRDIQNYFRKKLKKYLRILISKR